MLKEIVANIIIAAATSIAVNVLISYRRASKAQRQFLDSRKILHPGWDQGIQQHVLTDDEKSEAAKGLANAKEKMYPGLAATRETEDGQ